VIFSKNRKSCLKVCVSQGKVDPPQRPTHYGELAPDDSAALPFHWAPTPDTDCISVCFSLGLGSCHKPGTHKLAYLNQPVLNIWVSELGPDHSVELIWTWLEGGKKCHAYSHFLVPFNEACAKRHGIDNPIVDPVEVEVVKDWPTPEVTYCAPDFWREVRRLLENIF